MWQKMEWSEQIKNLVFWSQPFKNASLGTTSLVQGCFHRFKCPSLNPQPLKITSCPHLYISALSIPQQLNKNLSSKIYIKLISFLLSFKHLIFWVYIFSYHVSCSKNEHYFLLDDTHLMVSNYHFHLYSSHKFQQ